MNTSYQNEVYIDEYFELAISSEDANGNIDKSERTMNIAADSVESLSGQTALNLINGQGIFDSLSFNHKGLFSFEITDGSLMQIIEVKFYPS